MHNQDLIEGDDRLESVSNDQHGALAKFFSKSVCDQLISLEVYRARRLVKQDNLALVQDSSGQAEKLLFSSR